MAEPAEAVCQRDKEPLPEAERELRTIQLLAMVREVGIGADESPWALQPVTYLVQEAGAAGERLSTRPDMDGFTLDFRFGWDDFHWPRRMEEPIPGVVCPEMKELVEHTADRTKVGGGYAVVEEGFRTDLYPADHTGRAIVTVRELVTPPESYPHDCLAWTEIVAAAHFMQPRPGAANLKRLELNCKDGEDRLFELCRGNASQADPQDYVDLALGRLIRLRVGNWRDYETPEHRAAVTAAVEQSPEGLEQLDLLIGRYARKTIYEKYPWR